MASTLFIALSFTACGGGDDSSSTDSTIINVIADNETQTTDDTPPISEPNIIETNEPTAEDESTIPSKYYGARSYVDSGEEINILSTTKLDITEVTDDENLLKVNKDNKSRWFVHYHYTTIRNIQPKSNRCKQQP